MAPRVKLVVAAVASGRVTSSGKRLELGDVLLEGEIPEGLSEADVVLALRRGFDLFPVEQVGAKGAAAASSAPMEAESENPTRGKRGKTTV